MIIEYRRTTHFPTRIGNARFRVDDSGGVFVQVNREEPELDHAWCSDYPATPTATLHDSRSRIHDILSRHGFFSMPPHVVDDDRDDGYEEQLRYWDAEGVAHTTLVDRARVPAFRALINALASSLDILDEIG